MPSAFFFHMINFEFQNNDSKIHKKYVDAEEIKKD